MTNGGSGYATPPTVTITGGGGTGATTVAILDGDEVGSVVASAHGFSYTGNPTATITGGGGTGATAETGVRRISTVTQDFTNNTAESRLATATFDLTRGLVDADENLLCYVSYNAQNSTEQMAGTFDYITAYVPPFPVEDLLDLPGIPLADLDIGGPLLSANLPSLYLNSTRIDDPGNNPDFGNNGLLLIKVQGGATNRRFIFARGRNLRGMANVRFELRP